MLEIFQITVLAIVQGITEFLPISSSAHLAILEGMFGINEKLTITVFLHLGSLLALLYLLKADIFELIRGFKGIFYIFIGSLPAAIAGLFLKKYVELAFSSPDLIAIFLIITGLFIWLTRTRKYEKHLRLSNVIIIGIAQAISIFPGISRSGFTISWGILSGLDGKISAKFSFILAIVSIAGANLLEVGSINFAIGFPLLFGILLSFVVSLVAINFILRAIKHFWKFSIYCWMLGFLLLVLQSLASFPLVR